MRYEGCLLDLLFRSSKDPGEHPAVPRLIFLEQLGQNSTRPSTGGWRFENLTEKKATHPKRACIFSRITLPCSRAPPTNPHVKTCDPLAWQMCNSGGTSMKTRLTIGVGSGLNLRQSERNPLQSGQISGLVVPNHRHSHSQNLSASRRVPENKQRRWSLSYLT